MAIKVSGTTVIDDSRQLSNIASVDATTVAALGAAGVGGGGTVELTASGALSAGDPVIINSSGQAEAVSATVGSPANGYDLQESGYNSQYHCSAYSSVDDKILTLWSDSSGQQYWTHANRVGNEFQSQGDNLLSSRTHDWQSMAYSPTSNVFLMIYDDGTDGTQVRAMDFNVNSRRSLSTANVITTNPSYVDIVYDESIDKFVAAVSETGTIYIFWFTVTSSGSITKHNSGSTAFTSNKSKCKLATNGSGQFVVMADDYGVLNTKAKAFTLDASNNISYGSEVTIGSNMLSSLDGRNSVVYDSDSGAFVFSYNNNNDNEIKAATVSSNTLSFGSAVTINSSDAKSTALVKGQQGGLALWWVDDGLNEVNFRSLSVSGTTISLGTNTVITSNTTTPVNYAFYGYTTQNSIDDRTIFVLLHNHINGPTGVYMKTIARSISSNNSTFIGFAAENISNGSTGNVHIVGGLNENQSGLTIGTKYYVSATGALQTSNNGINAGIALSSTNLLVKG